MNNLFFKQIKQSVKHWYFHLIIGLIFIAVGFWVFTSPIHSYVALTIVFSISFLISGIMEILFATSNRKVLENWGWTLALGIFTTLVGTMLIANPAISAVTLPLYVGFMLIIRSFWAIGSAFDLKDYGVKGWGVSLFIGILGVLFAALIILRPAIGGITLVIWTGLALIASGAFNLFLSIKMRKIHKNWDNITAATKAKLEEAQALFIEEYRSKKSEL
ncbi:MAG: HdeD family acid-resistance protein [Bacteroidales bacterium]|nr:HdeD family acid-resistance protein [Bacteroidales bacterium]